MKETVGQRLRTVVKTRGLTIISLATKLGISRNRLAGVMNGKHDVDYLDMKALRKALALSPEEALWVFFPEESMLEAPTWLCQ